MYSPLANDSNVPTRSDDGTKFHCNQMTQSRMCRLLSESVENTPTTGHKDCKDSGSCTVIYTLQYSVFLSSEVYGKIETLVDCQLDTILKYALSYSIVSHNVC